MNAKVNGLPVQVQVCGRRRAVAGASVWVCERAGAGAGASVRVRGAGAGVGTQRASANSERAG